MTPPLWLKRMKERLLAAWHCAELDPQHEENVPFQQALEYARKFDPTNGQSADSPPNFAWVKEHAKAKLEEAHSEFEILDNKADSIIKYLGGGTAIVAIGTLANTNRFNAWLVLLLVPSLVLAIRAIYYATKARMPIAVTKLPSVQSAIEYAKYHAVQAEDRFLPTWQVACIGMETVLALKAEYVTLASRFYYRAILLLLLPIAIWPFAVWFWTPNSPRVELSAPPAKIEISVPAPQVKVIP